jgi:amino acid transporter
VIAAYAEIAGFGFDTKTLLNPDVAAAPLFALGSPGAAGGYGGGSDFMLKLLEIVVLLDVMAVGLGCSTASSRGIFALARDRRIPGALATVTDKGSPVAAIVFVEAFSVLMVAFAASWDALFAIPENPHEFAMFAWLSTFGGFALMVVYGLLAIGAFRGLADHPNRSGVVVAGVLGLAISAGAIFGGIYKQPNPFNLVWVYVAVWLVIGVVVTVVAGGREPASAALSELRSEGS